MNQGYLQSQTLSYETPMNDNLGSRALGMTKGYVDAKPEPIKNSVPSTMRDHISSPSQNKMGSGGSDYGSRKKNAIIYGADFKTR